MVRLGGGVDSVRCLRVRSGMGMRGIWVVQGGVVY
jgi:hypothetical protein